ncbi:MAG: hypothetical protein IJQ26_01520 [Lachnospiraceae bacterium]|nr:hypothetical protein [Lachnospiraceae bacterium]
MGHLGFPLIEISEDGSFMQGMLPVRRLFGYNKKAATSPLLIRPEV